MEILSFLSAPLAIAAAKTGGTDGLPTFRKLPWFRANRLDARPVAWSLRNRPEDWEWEHEDYTIKHKPSNHVFWIANGWGFYALYEANCSCMSTRGKFQRFQQFMFGRAFKHWRRNHGESYDPDHFASHFVTPKA
jgi:hypothetical protein